MNTIIAMREAIASKPSVRTFAEGLMISTGEGTTYVVDGPVVKELGIDGSTPVKLAVEKILKIGIEIQKL